MISKIMKQNRTTKLWKEEATATKLSFKKNKPKFFRSISLTSDRKKGFFESRSVSADLGYESSDTIHTTNYHDSSEEDEEECNYCYCCERRTFRRSMSAPVPGTQGSDVQSQKKACRHWQWYLRSSSSNWHNFNTHNFYCYWITILIFSIIHIIFVNILYILYILWYTILIFYFLIVCSQMSKLSAITYCTRMVLSILRVFYVYFDFHRTPSKYWGIEKWHKPVPFFNIQNIVFNCQTC